jgi:hypothetical protein
VSWVVVQQPGVAGLDCAYQNSAVRVCRSPSSSNGNGSASENPVSGTVDHLQ